MEIITSPSQTTDNQDPGRRSFLAVVIGVINTGIAGFLAITVGRFTAGPKTAPSAGSEWIDAGAVASIPDTTPTKLNLDIMQDAGWAQFNNQQSIWVIKKGEAITVFSAVCPHLGCSINTSANGFACPCHSSTWNIDGQKTGGPTPRPMDTLEHKIEDGVLKVKYQYFKQGLAGKETIA